MPTITTEIALDVLRLSRFAARRNNLTEDQADDLQQDGLLAVLTVERGGETLDKKTAIRIATDTMSSSASRLSGRRISDRSRPARTESIGSQDFGRCDDRQPFDSEMDSLVADARDWLGDDVADALAADFSTDEVGELCGVSGSMIRRRVRAFAAAKTNRVAAEFFWRDFN